MHNEHRLTYALFTFQSLHSLKNSLLVMTKRGEHVHHLLLILLKVIHESDHLIMVLMLNSGKLFKE